ncbi:MAG: rRNA maturation RNase YbeY [Bacteroidetes bacterium]|nr:rRNA maturation RNase YbeY [Bacteroidota bacterium]
MVEFFFEEIDDLPVNPDDTELWLVKVLKSFNNSLGDVNFIFCSDDYLLNINKEHLNHDYYTDIITFDYCDGKIVSGDLFISVDRVRDNAENLEIDFLDELHRVMVHGVLHLCGLKDKSENEAAEMRSAEDKALSFR